MLRGIIRGNIVSTRKQESLVGAKFMEVEIMDNGELTGRYIIAIDSVGADRRNGADHYGQFRKARSP